MLAKNPASVRGKTEVQGDQKYRINRQVLLTSLWLTLIVLAITTWLGWATQSFSLISQSLYTLIDSFSLLLSVIAVSFAPASNREIGGHGKLESLLALLLVGFLGFSCVVLLAVSSQHLVALFTAAPPRVSVQLNGSLLQLLGVVAATSFCLACLERYLAGVLKSNSVRFAAKRLFQNTWFILLVLLGLVGVSWGYLWLDPVLAIALVFLAIANFWQVLSYQLPFLVQQVAIAPEAIAQTIHQVEGITRCYGIRSRGIVGRQVFVEMRLVLHPECISIARTIAERVEQAIRDRYGPAWVVIYIDPEQISSKQ